MTHWRSVGFSLTVILLLPVTLLAQNARNVLVLVDGYPGQPGNVRFFAGLHEVFEPRMRNQIFEEYLDETRVNADDATVAELLRKKYEGKKFDLVVGAGEPVLAFLLRHSKELWPGASEIFIDVDDRQLPTQLPPNSTAIARAPAYGTTLDLALQLMPNTHQVFYVGGSGPTGRAWRAIAERDFEPFARKVEFAYLTDMPLADLLARLGRLPDHAIVVCGGLFQDASRQVYTPAQVCRLVASASNVPVYGSRDTFMGSGIVGGGILDFKDLGTQTARLALRILDRGNASGFPIETWRSHAVVD
jgi:hypothetical protein